MADTSAGKGKIKGKGSVTPAKAGAEDAEKAGHEASVKGSPSKPPAEYTKAEVEAWFRGYKSHANPQSTSTVEGIESGYRKNY